MSATQLRNAHVIGMMACAFALLGTGCRRETGTPPTIVFNADTSSAEFGRVELVGLHRDALIALDQAQPTDQQWAKIFAVFIGSEPPRDSATLPVLGRYDVLRDRLRFTPRFPPAAGQSYYVRFNGLALPIPVINRQIDTTVQMPRSAGNRTVVTAIYPSGDRVPMNLLRIYLHFSGPMSTGEAYRRVRVLDDANQEVKDAFLVIAGEQELWDPEHRRLTMLFDPGRIKRDLRPHEELGLPLQEGRSYTLVVDSGWADASGNPLAAGYRKRFTVGPQDRTLPRVSDWKVTAPMAGTRALLTLQFPESLDRALLERLLIVRTDKDEIIAGEAAVGVNETSWSFTPAAQWKPGKYVIDVGTDLEDLAGNNLRDVFDVDRKQPRAAGAAGERVRLPFAVK